MQILAIVVHLLAILVLVAMAAKYGLARGVQAYHREIIGEAVVDGNSGLKLVLGATYLAIGAGALAVALAYAVLVFRIAPATGFGEGYAFLLVCVLALPTLVSTYRIEQATKVRTPWRAIAIGFVLAAIAYGLSFAA